MVKDPVIKKKGKKPKTAKLWKKFKDDVLTTEVRQYLTQIESQTSQPPDFKTEIPHIRIAGTLTERVPKTGKEVVVCLIPSDIFNNHIKRVHSRLIGELEKKSNKQFILISQRKMLPNKRHLAQLKRQPLHQKLSAVLASYMEDICGPSEVVGKRTHIKTDGKRVVKVHVDPKDRTKQHSEDKLETFSHVYKILTNQDAIFMYPEN
eukprot:Selendium_serpulae@DN6230_c0_g1_i7.p4